jgi:hypothetical protein
MKLTILLSLLNAALLAADYEAGVARIKITPDGPIWMSGYANRTKPSEGVLQELWAKALAIDDGKGRVVIVTTDLIGLPRVLSDMVAARVQKQHGLDRSRLLLNSSHTHTGPVVRPNLATMYDLDAENQRRLDAYSRKLTEDLVNVVGAALADLKPAKLTYGSGTTGFAINRREATPKGVRIGLAPQGPVDHQVPVVRVTRLDGSLAAVLFGYACHNTTLTGEFYQISGDYAGFAQTAIEKAHSGTTAMFLMLCGADQNPNPRSTLDLAGRHGEALAAEVSRVLSGPMTDIRGAVRAAYRTIDLEFASHTRETFETEMAQGNAARKRRAFEMLKAYDDGRPVRRAPYPVQAVRFGKDLTVVALGGEVVVDYPLRIAREYPRERLITAGYSNDVMCYIPSLRVLREGGYEANDSMIYYGQPGPFAENVEESVMSGVHSVLQRVGARRGK